MIRDAITRYAGLLFGVGIMAMVIVSIEHPESKEFRVHATSIDGDGITYVRSEGVSASDAIAAMDRARAALCETPHCSLVITSEGEGGM